MYTQVNDVTDTSNMKNISFKIGLKYFFKSSIAAVLLLTLSTEIEKILDSSLNSLITFIIVWLRLEPLWAKRKILKLIIFYLKFSQSQ